MKTHVNSGLLVLEKPEAVFFDKDGTLIDIHHYWGSMIKIRADLICERLFQFDKNKTRMRHKLIEVMGLNIETGKLNRQGPIGVKPRDCIVNIVQDTIRNGGHEVLEGLIERIFTEVDLITEKNMSGLLRLLPGVGDLLMSLRSSGVPAFVLTTDLSSRATLALEALGISDYFEEIFGSDSVENTKPAPDLVEQAMQYGSYNIDRVAMIGDHQVDIQMGINAGVKVNIGVMTGLSDENDFASLRCHFIRDLTEIEIRD